MGYLQNGPQAIATLLVATLCTFGCVLLKPLLSKCRLSLRMACYSCMSFLQFLFLQASKLSGFCSSFELPGVVMRASIMWKNVRA